MDELAGLTGEARERAIDRLHRLQRHLENDHPLKTVAAAAGLPFGTAHRWASLYRQFGLAALARRKRTDIAPRDFSEAQRGHRMHRPTDAAGGAEAKRAFEPPLPVATICRRPGGWHKDLGERVAELLACLSHRYRPIWQALQPHCGWVLPLFRKIHPHCTHFWRCVRRSGARGLTPDCVRHPWLLYTDNGSDFTSQHLEQAGADLKIHRVFSIPGKPRGRGRIERFFRTPWLTTEVRK